MGNTNKQFKKTKWRTKPTGRKKGQKVVMANPEYVLRFISSFNIPNKQSAIIDIAKKTHFSVLQVGKAIEFLVKMRAIRTKKHGEIEVLQYQNRDDKTAERRSHSTRKIIEENRQNYINLVHKVWSAINGPNWKDYLQNRKQIRQNLNTLAGWEDHYRDQQSVSNKVLKKADALVPLLKALLRSDPTMILEAAKPFKWPNTKLDAITQYSANPMDVDDTGILHRFGYRVGKGGISEWERRDILPEILSAPVRDFDLIDGLPSPPLSCARLRRVAYAVAFLIRNAKRQHSRDYSVAIADWESDLRFLKINYYDGKCDGMNFQWPIV